MPASRDAVPVDALRDYFNRGVQRGDFTPAEIAERVGWLRPSRHRSGVVEGDGNRVVRSLGVKPHRTNGRESVQRALRYDRAVALCRAMGGDPIDFDV